MGEKAQEIHMHIVSLPLFDVEIIKHKNVECLNKCAMINRQPNKLFIQPKAERETEKKVNANKNQPFRLT